LGGFWDSEELMRELRLETRVWHGGVVVGKGRGGGRRRILFSVCPRRGLFLTRSLVDLLGNGFVAAFLVGLSAVLAGASTAALDLSVGQLLSRMDREGNDVEWDATGKRRDGKETRLTVYDRKHKPC
jgi:hypothetical protein